MSQLHTVLRRSVAHLDPTDHDGRARTFTSAREAMIRLLWSYDPPLTPSEIDSKIDEFDTVVSAIQREDRETAPEPAIEDRDDDEPSSLTTPEPDEEVSPPAPLPDLTEIKLTLPPRAPLARFQPLSQIGAPTPSRSPAPPKAETSTKAAAAASAPLADAAVIEALAALDRTTSDPSPAKRDSAITAKTTTARTAATAPEAQDDRADPKDDVPLEDPLAGLFDDVLDELPPYAPSTDEESDEIDDGDDEADRDNPDQLDLLDDGLLDDEEPSDEPYPLEYDDEAPSDDEALDEDEARLDDEALDDDRSDDGDRLSADDVLRRHRELFSDRAAFAAGRDDRDEDRRDDGDDEADDGAYDDNPLDDEPRRSLGERLRDFVGDISGRMIFIIAGVVLLLAAGLGGAFFAISRAPAPATTTASAPPAKPESAPELAPPTDIASVIAAAPEASPRPTPPAADVPTGALALETLNLFDGRDPSVFQSAPDNPVRFEGDTQGGFARVASSTNSTGSRITVGRGVYERLAGRTIRIVVVARAAATSPAPALRFAYQNGRSLSPWQDGDLGKEYAPLSTTWTVPKDRGGPETDAVLIEPGIPGDGTAADIKSVRIEVLK